MNTVDSIALAPILFFLTLLSAPLAFLYRAYLRIHLRASLGIVMGAAVLGAIVTLQRTRSGPSLVHRDRIDQILVPAACFLFFIFVIPFIVRMARALLFDDVNEAERRTGAEGMRAWLRGGNLVCAVAIPALGWYGYGYSPWALLLVALLAIVARPTINSMGEGNTSSRAADSSLAQDRERIMKMLESGTIQPDEASELLSALAATEPAAQPTAIRSPKTGAQRLAIGGGILLILSFFMPWFSVNLGNELSRVTSQLNAQMGSPFGNHFQTNTSGAFASSGLQLPSLETGAIKVSGANVGRGLGWFVILCGLVATAFTGFPQTLPDPTVRRMIAVSAFTLGAAMLIYIIGSSLRHVSYGVLFAVASYFGIGLGTFKRDRAQAI